MNEQENPINKAIREVIEEKKAMYQDDAKHFFPIIRNILGKEMPFTITDKEFLEIMKGNEVNENVKTEVLIEWLKTLPKGVRMILTEVLIESLEEETEFTFFQKCKLHKISKN